MYSKHFIFNYMYELFEWVLIPFAHKYMYSTIILLPRAYAAFVMTSYDNPSIFRHKNQ